MTNVIKIDGPGTLPKEMRRSSGIDRHSQAVIKETEEGVLPLQDVVFPVELYSAKRLAEFHRNNEASLQREFRLDCLLEE